MITAQEIQQILQASFPDGAVEVVDDGARHKNHAQAKVHGGGHFNVHIVSDQFESLTAIARHQAVYQALSMPRDEIHALSIVAKTTKEISL